MKKIAAYRTFDDKVIENEIEALDHETQIAIEVWISREMKKRQMNQNQAISVKAVANMLVCSRESFWDNIEQLRLELGRGKNASTENQE